MIIIRLRDVYKIYNPNKHNEVRALNGVSLEIEEGDMIAIQGVSGSGKSTLLHIIGCLDSPTSGEYFLFGDKIKFSNNSKIARIRGQRIGFVLQQFGLLFESKALDNVMVPMMFTNKSQRHIKKRAQEMLDRMGILHLKNKKVSQLSGGEKQRVAIARALANDPDIILADEPTGALDSKTGYEIISVFEELNKQGKTVLIVTHDDKVAKRCKHTIYMSDGKLYDGLSEIVDIDGGKEQVIPQI